MKTSMVILTFNQLHYTQLCIESIRKYTEQGTYEIIVVDNHSTDGTKEWLKQQEDIRIIFNDANLGFPKGCNQGIEIAEGENILLLNNDVIVTPHWLSNLITCLYSAEQIGAVGAVTNSCSNFQTIPFTYKTLEELPSFAEKNNISSHTLWEERPRLIGFCMLIKKEVVEKVGLLDERFSPGNFEDDDYCYRIREAGYKLMLCKDAFIHHFGSVSFGKSHQAFNDILSMNRNKFIDKWGFDPWSSDYLNHKVGHVSNEKTVSVDKPAELTTDEKKICFITLVNDETKYAKALHYIHQLSIPQGYSIEILCIQNAQGITKGYNHGMKKSNAKYKVYLHQDVYIQNTSFISDIVTLFENHPSIGLMGVAGSKTIPSNGIWWESTQCYGQVYDSHTGQLSLLRFGEVEEEYANVTALDGLIMITQYDVPWREDIFDGWHFYDLSQSLEFQLAGFEVAVPKQDTPWCIHDCGIIDMQNGYDRYRKAFLQEYGQHLKISSLIP